MRRLLDVRQLRLRARRRVLQQAAEREAVTPSQCCPDIFRPANPAPRQIESADEPRVATILPRARALDRPRRQSRRRHRSPGRVPLLPRRALARQREPGTVPDDRGNRATRAGQTGKTVIVAADRLLPRRAMRALDSLPCGADGRPCLGRRRHTRAFRFGDGRNQPIVVLAAQCTLDRRGSVTRYQEMYGRGVGRRLGHGAPRFPELHSRSRVARGNGGSQLPRRRPPLFAFGEGRGLRGIGRALVWFDAVESQGGVVPDAVRAVRLETGSRRAGGISRGTRPRRPGPERDLTLVAAVRGNPIPSSRSAISASGGVSSGEKRIARRTTSSSGSRASPSGCPGKASRAAKSAERVGRLRSSRDQRSAAPILVGSIPPAFPQAGMPSQDAQ